MEGYTFFTAAKKSNRELQPRGKGASMTSITLSVLSDAVVIIVSYWLICRQKGRR